jgi:hypothetical protein
MTHDFIGQWCVMLLPCQERALIAIRELTVTACKLGQQVLLHVVMGLVTAATRLTKPSTEATTFLQSDISAVREAGDSERACWTACITKVAFAQQSTAIHAPGH